MSAEEYPKTPRSTVNRYRGRANYDHETIHSIVDQTPVLHVSFIPLSPTDDPFPATLPMIGCTGTYPPSDTTTPSIYLHGYVSSRLMRLPTSPSNTDSSNPEGTPVTIAATLLDGIVLALTPNHHSCNYRSAVLHGFAHLVTDPAEKMYAMELITNNILPQRWENTRLPPTKTEMTSTAILRVEVVSASAKVRAGGPGEDRADLRDQEVVARVWTGVLPAWTQYGEPVAADTNGVGSVPGCVGEWVKGENRRNREFGIGAVGGK